MRALRQRRKATELLAAERDLLAQRTAALETANRELQDFSYAISHDLRSPLRAISGYAQIVAEDHAARLDPEGRREVLGVTRRLHATGTTVVLVTHFMSEAVLAERVVVLAEGKIALDGSPREVFAQRERLRELDLDVPPVTAVALRGRAAGVAIRGLPLTVDEFVSALP